MLARNLAEVLDRSADAAIGEAVDSRGDEAIERAVSCVGAASDARDNEVLALERWVSHLDRVDEVAVAAKPFASRRA